MKRQVFTLSVSGLAVAMFLLFSQYTFGQVSKATMQQIEALIAEKNNRTPAQRKIDSRLLQAVKENRSEKMADGIDLEPANVDADNFGTLKVDIKAAITDAFLSKITSLGGIVIYASVPYQTVRASVSLKVIERLAASSEVKFIEPAVKSMVVDADANTLKKNSDFEKREAVVRAQLINYMARHVLEGSVTSQGDADHRATDVRSTYGFLGQGIKIGVLSDSYNAKGNAASDVTKGDLPGTGNPDGYTTPVTVVEDYSGGEDEGRAMLQVIHDIAPAATLYFATADVSEAGFASNIQTLRSTYGCNIIVDDVAYFDEPAFQDGIVAQAVNTVTAAGALYFSSAGNSGSLAKGTSGVFEGDFNDAGSSAFSGGSKAGTIHNFGTTTSPINGDVIKSLGGVYNLNWADPWGASSNDYDLFLVSSSGTVRRSSTNVQSGTQNPYEQVSAGSSLTSGDRLVVFKTTAAAVRAFHLNTNRGTLTKATNGQTTGHACAANAFCMAATPAATAFTTGYPTGPYPNPFVSANKVEPFSSDGPRKKFYNQDGTAITSGAFTFASNGGITLAKPDLTAADGVSTTFGSSTGLSPFFGTSCAAPHAGAIAALLLSGNPSLTTSQVRTILTSTALDVENSGYDNISGYGIIQAYQAAAQAGGTGTTCNVPTGLAAGSITTSSAVLSWTAASGAVSYTLQYKLASASTYTTVTGITATSYTLSGLAAGTSYNAQVATVCSSGTSAYSSAITFTTTGSGTVTYCTSSGGSSDEYISKVALGSISNTSGNNGGYANYTSQSTTLAAGSSYTATLTPGFTSTKYNEAWTMWIDYNGDGDFVDAGEKAGTATAAKTAKTITFTVPATAKSGSTRIRIQMKYSSASTASCGTYTYGEVEDYTGVITGGSGFATTAFVANSISSAATGTNALSIYPNPVAHGNANVSYSLAKEGNTALKVIDMAGRTAQVVNLGNLSSGSHTYSLLTKGKLNSGSYLVVLEQDGQVIGRSKLVVAE